MSLEAIVGLVLSVSIASERLVEIIKSMIPWLNQMHADAAVEGRRRASLQVLAVVSGVATAFLAEPILAPSLGNMENHLVGIIAIGLLASGGSGFWNVILTYLLQLKDLKKLQVSESRPAMEGYPDPIMGGEQVTSNECYDVGER
ncbi:hypothetical protein D3874_13915 [Oleomonas cavernae]|uniref:Uncharacterized protein n=1 Tax=Oleomonas cavernae TaxID=2320859 RepID=A0A418WD81_9PROT|nr:hypothetical protein D3874_13915 [Oleomonas cavernae]